MTPEVISKCEVFFGKKISQINSLSGGSINDAFQIKVKDSFFFIKTNTESFASQMFQTEAKGLQLLQESNTIKIPNIIHQGKAGQTAFLILEYIDPSSSSDLFWGIFGNQLAQLHQVTSTTFGLDHSNYIGSLFQQNNYKSNWVDFFIEERMLPQIQLAKNQQLLPHSFLRKFEHLFKKLNSIFPLENPSLIHGDLWNGNFLVGKNNQPILIDPSVSFGHREMDIAMTMLFGGFTKKFYECYDEVFPLQPKFQKRVKIYQLYYLMVHVNIFGKSYLKSVEDILDSYQ